MADRLDRPATVRAFLDRAQRGDPQRKKIELVATAHYFVRVMWATLKHGAVREKALVLAKGLSAA
jgi:hypothetical protein